MLFGALYGFVFLVDRIFWNKINGFKATLVFPLAYTSLDFLSNLFNPFGTTGALGYSQIEFLSFSQLASITGMWGMTFMITWFGSVVSWCLLHKKNRKKGLIVYASILTIILVFGNFRLTTSLEKGTVQISSMHTHDKNIGGYEMWKSRSKNDTIAFRKISKRIIQDLINKTSVEADAGSKIIVWSEISAEILKSDENELIEMLKSLSREKNIYIMTNLLTIVPKGQKPENKILMFTPTGDIVIEHFKFGGNFLEGSVEGDKTIKTIETKYGKVAGIICWDADFPSIVKQIGKSKTDILLIPASDWKEIDPLHTIVAVYRGIENGCSVVRQTRNGLSIMTDSRGKTISQLDHFSTENWVMMGQVPNKRIWTLYPLIGDLFGWLSIIGLGVMLFFGIRRKRLRKTTATNNV